MKKTSRILSFLLAAILLTTGIPTATAAPVEVSALLPHTVSIVDNSGVMKSKKIYELNGKVMMSISDIASYTRCTVDVKDSVYSLWHAGGFVILYINADTGVVTENNSSITQEIDVVMLDGTLYLDAYPVLTYFGAIYSVDSIHNILGIFMPQITFWESLFYWAQNIGYLNYYTVSGKTGGIIDNQNATIFLNSMTTFISGHTTTMEDAIYSALELDLSQFDTVMAARQDRTETVNEFYEKFATLMGLGSSAIGLGDLFDVSVVNEAFMECVSLCGSNQDYLTAIQNYQTIVEGSESFQDLKTAGNILDSLLLGIDTFLTISQRANINQVTKEAFINTFSWNTVSISGASDLSYMYLLAARNVSDTLASSDNILYNTMFEKAIEFIVDKVKKEALQFAFKETLPALCAELGIALSNLIALIPGANYFFVSEPQKAEASLKCIYAANYYLQSKDIFLALKDVCGLEDWRNLETILKFRDSYLIMLRFILLNYESNIQYGQLNNYFNRYGEKIAQCEKIAGDIAKTLDDAENAAVSILPLLSDLVDGNAEFSAQVLGIVDIATDLAGNILPPFPTIDTTIDNIRIVDITPASFSVYGQDVHFVVTIDYSLQSVEQGIIYLGFNTDNKDRYALVEDNLQVNRGSGRITLEATVAPVQWGSPNQGIQGGLDAIAPIFGGSSPAFEAYVNISEYPHSEKWFPLAIDWIEIPRK